MFKKFTQEESVSSHSQVKSSVGRAIRSSVLELYPALEDVVEEILPKKESMVLAKCADHISLLLVNRKPVFFQIRDGPWFPTLRLVHLYPSAFASSTWQTDSGAIKFVLGGAQIMCPGFTNGAMDVDIPLEAPVVVGAHGKRHAMCVGRVKMTRSDIASVNKGIAVENLHFLGDGLWQLPTID